MNDVLLLFTCLRSFSRSVFTLLVWIRPVLRSFLVFDAHMQIELGGYVDASNQ